MHEVNVSTYPACVHTVQYHSDVTMGAIASQITSLTIVTSNHKWPVTRKMFPIDEAIMEIGIV